MIEWSLSMRVSLSCASTALLLLTTGLISQAQAVSLAYSPRIEARVIGSDGMPVANVLVVANWNIVGAWNGASRGQLALFEVTTGSDGKFSIPAWGPRYTMQGTVTAASPTLRVLKPGYRPRVIYNVEGLEKYDPAPTVIHFRLQGQDILLIPSESPANRADVNALNELWDSTIELCNGGSQPCKMREHLMSRARQLSPAAVGAASDSPSLTRPMGNTPKNPFAPYDR